MCGSQVVLKCFRVGKHQEKSVGLLKRENSLGAPKWAIHVKIFMNDLFKLIKGTFHLLGLGLSDLKGGCDSIFCASSMDGICCFCPLTSHGARVAISGGAGQNSQKDVQWAYIKLGFRVRFPGAGQGTKKSILLCPPSLNPPPKILIHLQLL